MTKLRALVCLGVAVALGYWACGGESDQGPGGGTSDGGVGGHGGTTGRPGSSLRFAVIGDYGDDSSAEEAVAALVRGWAPDFVITTGDNNYQTGSAEAIDRNIGKHYQEFIGNYHGAYGPGSPTNRFWPVPGDHEWLTPGLVPYLDYFTLPGNERYYDVDLGLVHLFGLSTDRHEPDGNTADSPQAAWLAQRLAASTSCFDVVSLHHAPYSSGHHGGMKYMRWPFAAQGADVVLAGNDHDYERLAVDGLPYFVVGFSASTRPFREPVPESQARFTDGTGAMLVMVDGSGMTFEAWTSDGVLVDSYQLSKDCP